MSEQKERKPLVLSEIMTGLGGLYDPMGVTHFVATEPLGNLVYLAQMMWLSKQLPSWIARLNEESGAVVRGARLAYEIEDQLSKKQFIVLEMAIKGGIKLDDVLDDGMQKGLSGQVKKLLAERLLERFPPPFDCQNPPVIANWPLVYCIHGDHDYFLSNAEKDKFKSEKFFDRLNEVLSGHLMKLVAKPEIRGSGGYIQVEFLKEDTRNDCHQVARILFKFLREEQGISAAFPEPFI
jgi:hypothetical protein